MGIRFLCPSGHKLNVKTFLAGKRAICPQCGAKVIVPNLPAEPDVEPPLAADFGTSAFAAPGAAAGITVLDANSASTDELELDLEESPASTPAMVHGLPESVFAVPGPIVAVYEPETTNSETQVEIRRDQARRNQLTLLVVLAMVVIILAGVLIWVLNRTPPEAEPAAEEEATPVSAVAVPSNGLYC